MGTGGSSHGTMVCRWIMPYRKSGEIRIHNLSTFSVKLESEIVVSPWKWTDDTYYFHAIWWTDEPYMANPVRDMTFVEVKGERAFMWEIILLF